MGRAILAKLLMALVVLAAFVPLAHAEYQVIDSIQVAEGDGCSTIEVKFNFPIRYVKHFPYDAGDDLRVQLEAILARDKDALSRRETVLPPHDTASGLDKAVYEGDVDGGPFLTFIFTSPVRYRVTQGSDYRKMVVTVIEEEENSCTPAK